MDTLNPHHSFLEQQLPTWTRHTLPAHWQQMREHLRPRQGPTDGFADAAPELQQAVEQAQARLRQSQRRLQRALQSLQGITDFAEPRLKARLLADHGLDLDVARATLTRVTVHHDGRLTERRVEEPAHSLLQAALLNFSSVYFDPPSALHDGAGQRLPLAPQSFAQLCRDLDLGAQYQAHLEQRFDAPACLAAIEVHKDQLRVDLHLARLRRQISGAALAMLQDLIDGPSALQMNDTPELSRPKLSTPEFSRTFSLFGIALHDVLLIGPLTPAAEQLLRGTLPRRLVDAIGSQLLREISPIVAYFPGDRHAPLVQHDSLKTLHDDLLNRLCQADFRRFFARFVPLEQRGHFFSVLKRNLAPDAADDADWVAVTNADLHLRQHLIDEELFAHLQAAQLLRLKTESLRIAVPTASADEQAQKALLETVLDRGLNFLNLASFFVPGLGEVMLGVFAGQLLYQSFEGIEAWQDGDIGTAMEHLEAVALNLAVATGISVGVGGALALRKVFNSQLMESLVQVPLASGEERLWLPNLASYRSDVQLPEGLASNARGQFEFDGQHYVHMDGALYAQHFDAQAEQWRLVHPRDPEAYQPPLFDNGEGAWRHLHERPLTWTRDTLLRRLGYRFEQYSANELEHASQISGLSDARLRRLHVAREPVPALLLDSLARLKADRLATKALAEGSTQERKVLFAQRYQKVEGADPLQQRLARAREGLYRPTLLNREGERLALAAIGRLEADFADMSLALRADAVDGPILERIGQPFAVQQRTVVKSRLGYQAFAEQHALHEPVDDLFTAIVGALPEPQRNALGLASDDSQALRVQVQSLVEHAPEQLPQWLWAGRNFTWNNAGRLLGGADRPVGYPPASPASSSVVSRYRALYPATTDAQARAAIDAWHAQDLVPATQLRVLEREYSTLRPALQAWAFEQENRQLAAEAIVEAWQRIPLRQLESAEEVVQLNLDGLNLTGSDLDDFPALQASLAHVQELSLNDNPLGGFPSTFALHFSQVRHLALSNCQIEQIPAGLNHELQVLDLSDNRITWNAQQQQTLDSYPHLYNLNLSNNHLVTAPNLSALADLGGVDLSDCDLSALPAGLISLHSPYLVDLSSNHVSELPIGFHVPPTVGHALNLENNPLSARALTQLDEYYVSDDVDLLVSRFDYQELLSDANEAQRQIWQRLQATVPLSYLRSLRDLYEIDEYRAAPATTRRRIWAVLQWMDVSARALGRGLALEPEALLSLEADAARARALSAPSPQDQSQQLLRLVNRRIWSSEINVALTNLVPAEVSDLDFEALRQLTLQQLVQDTQIDIPLAPRPDETVSFNGDQAYLEQLDAQWLEQLHLRLLALLPDTAQGLDAILNLNYDLDYIHSDWIERLRARYPERFAELRADLDQRQADAEQNMSNGEYLLAVNRLHAEFKQRTDALLRTLTRSIHEGTASTW